jgi:hypothetical protein
VAGRVSEVGEDVDPAWIGRRVVTRTDGAQGWYAERVAVLASGLVPVPDGVDVFDAVPLLTDGPTALCGPPTRTRPRSPARWPARPCSPPRPAGSPGPAPPADTAPAPRVAPRPPAAIGDGADTAWRNPVMA